jgi:hypothetical protein
VTACRVKQRKRCIWTWLNMVIWTLSWALIHFLEIVLCITT